MKAMNTLSSSPHSTNILTFTKIVSFSLLSFSLFFIFKYFSAYTPPTAQNQQLSFFNTTRAATTPLAQPSPPPPPPPERPLLERTGIINELGIMTEDFVVGEFDEGLIESIVVVANSSDERESVERGDRKVVKFEKFRICEMNMSNYVPFLDNVDSDFQFNLWEKGKGLDCLVPRPKEYKLHIPWPKSRDEVWFDNVPHTHLDKTNEDAVLRKGDKLVFPGDGPQFIPGTDKYLDQISKMVPEIAFGRHTRVALDISSGLGNFGAYLLERNVTTLSIAPKDVHRNQIQLALERGVPAMIATFGRRRLPYPSQAFDLIHCSRCGVNWTVDGGILLLEANRLLRGGGYFVWEAEPVYMYEDKLGEQWRAMEDLTSNICWELVNKEEYIAIWQKPLNNSCYLSRDPNVQPSLCNTDDNPEDIWHVDVKACITRLPENGYGTNTSDWPARLHSPPDRLFTIEMDAEKSRKELYKADSRYRNDIVRGYVGAFHLNQMNLRNVMDMKAGYGGYAAALVDFQFSSWVMNVVPVSGPNTLPVIYDRGFIGVMHDWCEPFNTYPRTYDLLNAAGLFSVEQRRCNITNIMLEMDRILRPGGRVYIRDITAVIEQLEEIAKAVGWVPFVFDSGEGPHSNWKLLACEKRL
ncbi:probable methyltransferase PMT10 [Salvia miltiorrhiza]|uniref:probable methyltransferase PMT10 n=1 Tax=Salvia miltiorrhiza TaxID=226208 RepID=UPI0025ACF100|nr:probable methyltransferase PMT10 [Salvia miltiorrhiza]